MPRVFISHCTEDLPLVESALMRPLRDAGFDTWVASHEMPLTGSLSKGIDEGMKSSNFFVLALTARTPNSEWVAGEVADALEHPALKRRFFIAAFDATPAGDVDKRLAAHRRLDFASDPLGAGKRLAQRLRGELQSPRPTSFRTVQDRDPLPPIRALTSLLRAPDARERVEQLLRQFRQTEDSSHPANAPLALLEGMTSAELASLAEVAWATSDPEIVDGFLSMLDAIKSSDVLVSILDRACHQLDGDNKLRAIRLNVRKRASLEIERLNEILGRRQPAYAVVRALGVGAYTASYLVKEPITEADRVLRALLPGRAEELNDQYAFVDLGRRTAKYRHRHVAATQQVDVIAEARLFFTIRDYIDGPPLQHLLESKRPLPRGQVRGILCQLAQAIDYIHSFGDVHNGVRPTNIFFASNGDLVLGDPSLPAHGVAFSNKQVLYYFRYCAPEAFTPGTPLHRPLDTYAFGCVAHHLIHGEPPFISDNPGDLIRMHAEAPLPALANDAGMFGVAGNDLIRRCLEKKPGSRPEHLEELVRKLPDDDDPRHPVQASAPPRDPRDSPAFRSLIRLADAHTRTPAPLARQAPDPGAPIPGRGERDSDQPAEHARPELPSLPPPSSPPHQTAPPSSLQPGPGARREREEDTRQVLDVPAHQTPSPTDPTAFSTGWARDRLEYREFVGAGDHLGPYRLLERIGEGGQGVVWLAERPEFLQRVAIKIVRSESSEWHTGLDRERRLLSLLDHPNIARILDAGTTPDGRPYFVMEYVRGEHINKYCDARRTGVRTRLELFLRVCEAVQHAHLKGIIHRDVKPSNILVTERDDAPQPKVIDFGIAKVIDDGLVDRNLVTTSRHFKGTLGYMSPEQAQAGEVEIDTRTDIYSLGVVLYELLTGSLPLDPKELDQSEHARYERLVRTYEPPRPSARVAGMGEESAQKVAADRLTTTKQLARELARELDWVVLKALARDPADRYQTVTDLADDIRRYLDGRTLRAAGPSSLKRTRRILRRNLNRGLLLLGTLWAAVATLILLLRSCGVNWP